MTSLDHWSYAAEGAAAPLRTIVRITPTRKFIEKRYPTLGFTVDSGGHPFFEVLLTTDRALFEAGNAARRTPATFYASREHSGLLRAGDEASVYLVPTAVMQRFAGAREIFYTAACYATAEGRDPVYAIPPAQLSREAPSVGVASDFQGRALAASFAIPAELLQRVRDDDGHAFTAGFEGTDAPAYAYGDPERDAESDRAGGEDGYGMTAALDYDDDYGPMSGEQQAEDELPDAPAGEPPQAGAAAVDYDDGYDDPIPAAGQSAGRSYGDESADDEYASATAQQSTYAAGTPPPSMLEDEDEARRSQDGTYPESAAYGDEADEDAGTAPAYQSLGGVPLTPREQRRITDIAIAVSWPCQSYTMVQPETEPATTPRTPLPLVVGIVPFTQWSGTLGELLKTMEKRDAGGFQRIFGSKWKDLLDTTTASTNADRMKAVDGKELFREPWLTRFKKAGEHKPFQSAQNETAAALFLAPIVSYAHGLGLNSDRGLAMLTVLMRRDAFNTQWPVGSVLHWVVNAISPFKTDPQRQQALATLGTAFQQAQKLDPKGKPWSNVQHYAVLAELRKSGRSPVPLPALREMLDSMVKYAVDNKDPSAGELANLRTNNCLQDVEYAP